jgi:regulatory subunit for Cdc7p protein kinase
MAAVSIAQSPHSLSNMSGRRVPLSSNPNAANSPYRAVAAAAAAQKHKRSYANIQREEAYGQAPPAKKQMLEATHLSLRTPPRQSAAHAAEGRVFTRRSNAAQPTAFDRKLEAVRVRSAQQQAVAKVEKASEENLETIRQWQRHYRKVFPKYVFYFESVAEDVHAKYAKQVTALGAVSISERLGLLALLTIFPARRQIFLQCSHPCCYHQNNPSRTCTKLCRYYNRLQQ